MDYYDILGVSKKSTLQEIKAAYRKKALQWHPDRNKSKDAEKQFKEINQAYEVLSNPEKRNLYDQVGHSAFSQRSPGGSSNQWQQGPFTYTYSSSQGSPFEGFDVEGFTDPFQIFEQFFGFGGQTRTKQKPTYQINLTFEESVKGVTKKVNVEGTSKKIKIPAGVENQTRIRYSDFDLILSVEPDSRFRRQGQDIISDIKIPLSIAILGGTVEVPSIEGDTLKIKVKSGTQPGSMLRLAGRGIPSPYGKGRGDHYVVFKIHIPEKLSNKQKKLLEEFENEA